jgi:hypothetical protein
MPERRLQKTRDVYPDLEPMPRAERVPLLGRATDSTYYLLPKGQPYRISVPEEPTADTPWGV